MNNDEILEYINENAILQHSEVTSKMMNKSVVGLSKVSEELSTLILNYLRHLPPRAREEIQSLAGRNVYYFDNFKSAISRYHKDIDNFSKIIDMVENMS